MNKKTMNEKFQELKRWENVSLFSYIGSWGGTHTLTTRTKGGETFTVQGETMKRLGMNDKDLVNEGYKWARSQVGNDTNITYSNSKQIPLLETGITTVALTINEAVKQHKYERNKFQALFG